jgi:hypothetical protein
MQRTAGRGYVSTTSLTVEARTTLRSASGRARSQRGRVSREGDGVGLRHSSPHHCSAIGGEASSQMGTALPKDTDSGFLGLGGVCGIYNDCGKVVE